MIPSNVKEAISFLTEADPKTKAICTIDGYLKSQDNQLRQLRAEQGKLPSMNMVAEKFIETWLKDWRKNPSYKAVDGNILHSSPIPNDFSVYSQMVTCKYNDGMIHFDIAVQYPTNRGGSPIPKSLLKSHGYAIRCKNPKKKEEMLEKLAKRLVKECGLPDGEFLLPTINTYHGALAGHKTFSVTAYLKEYRLPYTMDMVDLSKKVKFLDDEVKRVEGEIKHFSDCIPEPIKIMLQSFGRNSEWGIPGYCLPFGWQFFTPFGR